MLRSCVPSFQLTVTRTSRTLFLSVSRKPVAWACSMPATGEPGAESAEAPPWAPPSICAAPASPAVSELGGAPVPDVPPDDPDAPPCDPIPNRPSSCAASIWTSGLRISARHS